MANGVEDRRKLADKVREVICQEWREGAAGPLESAVVHRRLLDDGVEVPAYQMSAILNAFKVGGLIAAPLRPQSEGEVRKHGDVLIRGVSPDLCDSSRRPPHSPVSEKAEILRNSASGTKGFSKTQRL